MKQTRNSSVFNLFVVSLFGMKHKYQEIMAYNSLKDFVLTLDNANELISIKEFVDPVLEISEIADRVSKSMNNKALFFLNNGTEFPLLINSMGSDRRICLALRVNRLDEIGERIEKFSAKLMSPRSGLINKLALLPRLAEVSGWVPKNVKGKGLCQEVVMDSPDLGKLPILQCWPYDKGRFITLPVVHTVHPQTGIRNVGMYRMQVFAPDLTGMHWHLHKNSATHFREYRTLGKKMPVSVVLGGDPVYTYVASAPLPENIDEYLLAGFLRNKKVELVKCLTNDITVPSDADFIIEGYVDPKEDLILEGPFGDHTGFYSLEDYYPRFHVTCITHRKDAIYPATVVGIPPQEDAYIGKATERIFLRPIRLSMVPEIVDMVMPAQGVFHNIVLVSIKKTFPGQSQKVMNSLWGAGQMMLNKILVVLDEDVDLNDYNQVLVRIFNTVDPLKDILFSQGPLDVLDHSSSRFAIGSKIGIDATQKAGVDKINVSEKRTFLVDSDDILKNKNVQYVNTSMIDECLPLIIIGVQKNEKNTVHDLHNTLVKKGLLNNLLFVVYVESLTEGFSLGDLTWLVANNIDPARDCFYSLDEQENKQLPFAVDGTNKSRITDDFQRQWPNVVTMDKKTIEAVDIKWEKLGLGDFVKSPSLKYGKLVLKDGAVAEK